MPTVPPTPTNPANVNTEPDDSDPTLPIKDGVDIQLARRIIFHISNLDHSEPLYTQTAYTRGTAVVFRYLCDLLGMDHSNIPSTRSAKRPVFDLLMHSVSF